MGDRNGLKRCEIWAVEFPSDGSRAVRLVGSAESRVEVGLEPEEQYWPVRVRVLTDLNTFDSSLTEPLKIGINFIKIRNNSQGFLVRSSVHKNY